MDEFRIPTGDGVRRDRSLTMTVLEDYLLGAVSFFDRCPDGDRCAHCAAGRPSQPVEAGDPRDLSMAVVDVDDGLRLAMPPRFHRPEYAESFASGGWFCACCWTDGRITSWPCLVAQRHGKYLRRSMMLELRDARRAGIAPAA